MRRWMNNLHVFRNRNAGGRIEYTHRCVSWNERETIYNDWFTKSTQLYYMMMMMMINIYFIVWNLWKRLVRTTDHHHHRWGHVYGTPFRKLHS